MTAAHLLVGKQRGGVDKLPAQQIPASFSNPPRLDFGVRAVVSLSYVHNRLGSRLLDQARWNQLIVPLLPVP